MSLCRIFLLLLCLIPYALYAQTGYEGQVVNKATEVAVSGVTVRLLKELSATQTNQQGYYKLIPENAVPNDTLIFSSIGYQTYRLPVSQYQPQLFIALQPSTTALNEVTIINNKTKTITLNKFTLLDVREIIRQGAIENGTRPYFTPQIYAKLFEAPQDDVVIDKILVGRRQFESRVGASLITANDLTTFLIHVIAIDPKTGNPGDILYTKQVWLDDNALINTIDLTAERIIVPRRKFCIAIEWLRIPYNQLISLGISDKAVKTNRRGFSITEPAPLYRIVYQPALIAYQQPQTALSWTKTNTGKWLIFHHPESEIALSATVHY